MPALFQETAMLRPTLFTLALSLLPAAALAAVPATMAVDGIVLTQAGSAAPDGKYGLLVRLYDGPAQDANELWKEFWLAVPVKGGAFHLNLGTVDAKNPLLPSLFGAPGVHMGVQIDNEPELARVPLHSVGFAMHAALADAAANAKSAELAKDLDCPGCVQSAEVAFSYAASQAKGGPADIALALKCSGCVGPEHLAAGSVGKEQLAKGAVTPEHLSFGWAKSDEPGGIATKAAGLQCTGCVAIGMVDKSIADAFVNADGDFMSGALHMKGYDAAAPLVFGTDPAKGRVFQRGDGAVLVARGGVQAGGKWTLDDVGQAATALVLTKDGRARFETDTTAQPLGTVHAVNAKLAPDETLIVKHGRNSLDVAASGWQLKSGTWTMVVGSSAVASAFKDSDLMAWWSFDDCTAKDSSGKGYNGAKVGSPGCVDGKFGKATDISGGSFKHWKLQLDDTLAVFTQKFTFAMWAKVPANAKPTGLFAYDNGNNTHVCGIQSDGPISCSWNGPSMAGGKFPVNTWVHFAETWNGKDWTFFVNGQQVAQSQQAPLPLGKGNCLHVGEDADANCDGGGDGDTFPGQIDEFMAYRRALTAPEIGQLVVGPTAQNDNGVVIEQVDANAVRLVNKTGAAGEFRLVVIAP
jgi:hypothetical protein